MDTVRIDRFGVGQAFNNVILMTSLKDTDICHPGDVRLAETARDIAHLDVDWKFVHRNERDHGTILAEDKELGFERLLLSHDDHCRCSSTGDEGLFDQYDYI